MSDYPLFYDHTCMLAHTLSLCLFHSVFCRLPLVFKTTIRLLMHAHIHTLPLSHRVLHLVLVGMQIEKQVPRFGVNVLETTAPTQRIHDPTLGVKSFLCCPFCILFHPQALLHLISSIAGSSFTVCCGFHPICCFTFCGVRWRPI